MSQAHCPSSSHAFLSPAGDRFYWMAPISHENESSLFDWNAANAECERRAMEVATLDSHAAAWALLSLVGTSRILEMVCFQTGRTYYGSAGIRVFMN